MTVSKQPVSNPEHLATLYEITRQLNSSLDLDVVLTHDGVVAVLDEDEFGEHRVRYGYPPEIVDLALGGAQTARSRLENRDPPFDGIAQEWLARVDPATLA